MPKSPLLLSLVTWAALLVDSRVLAQEAALTRIAFGSCAKQDKPQPIWDAIVELKPQLFLFLGDNIYGDTTDMEELKAKYKLLGNQPGYQKLKQTCPVLATWDDHDYGANDAGADFPMKRDSQRVFLDFFEAPKDDPRRSREGVYSAQVFGPVGKRVQVILLDTRYFRSPLKPGMMPGEPGEGSRGQYAPDNDPKSTILGETQWKWLEEQFKVPAEIRLIGSSFQLIADDHGFEAWCNFPRERTRFLNLLIDKDVRGVIILSGDRHLAEISRIPSQPSPYYRPEDVAYPLVDITSSSLNAPSGNMTKAGTRFINEINSHRVGLQYFDTNFGAILIDWDQPDPVVRLQVRDEKGGVVLQYRMALSELRPERR